MLKRLIKVIILGLILGTILSFGIVEYQNDQDKIHDRIARIQRQQIMIIQGVDNSAVDTALNLSALRNETGLIFDDITTIIKNIETDVLSANSAILTIDSTLNIKIENLESDLYSMFDDAIAIATKAANNPLPALVKKVAPSVVYVEAFGRWHGSGVIIGPHTVLTARHIIRDADKLYIETVDGKKYDAISWMKDEKNDCGLLFFDPEEEFKDISEFADSDRLQIGDIVFTMGSPFGKELFNTITFGIVSGLDRKISYFGTCGLITSDAVGNPGNSGGPIFNMQGKVIGIVVGTRYGSQGLNIIVPSNICKELYDERADKTKIGKSNSSS